VDVQAADGLVERSGRVISHFVKVSRVSGMLPAVVVAAATAGAPPANADNQRLNNGVVANVYTVQHQAGCAGDVKINPQLRLAAETASIAASSSRYTVNLPELRSPSG
jgi:hypothetical protein